MLQQLQLLELLSIKSQWQRMTRRESFFYNFCRDEFSAGFPREPRTFKGMFPPYFERGSQTLETEDSKGGFYICFE